MLRPWALRVLHHSSWFADNAGSAFGGSSSTRAARFEAPRSPVRRLFHYNEAGRLVIDFAKFDEVETLQPPSGNVRGGG